MLRLWLNLLWLVAFIFGCSLVMGGHTGPGLAMLICCVLLDNHTPKEK